MFKVNSMDTNCPREVWAAVSVAQTGVMAFRIPVPMPFNTRAFQYSVSKCFTARNTYVYTAFKTYHKTSSLHS
jgi:hypothetical protein